MKKNHFSIGKIFLSIVCVYIFTLGILGLLYIFRLTGRYPRVSYDIIFENTTNSNITRIEVYEYVVNHRSEYTKKNMYKKLIIEYNDKIKPFETGYVSGFSSSHSHVPLVVEIHLDNEKVVTSLTPYLHEYDRYVYNYPPNRPSNNSYIIKFMNFQETNLIGTFEYYPYPIYDYENINYINNYEMFRINEDMFFIL